MSVDFATSVEQYVQKAKGQMNAAFRGIGFEAGARVKELTPVDTGFLRANWLDTIDADVEMTPSPSPIFGVEVAQAVIGDTIYILNPVVYARRINYGFVGEDSLGRTYNQQGVGMVEQVVTELPEIADGVVQRISMGVSY